MRIFRPLAVLAAALGLALAASAAAGAAGARPAAGAALSPAAYRTQASALCDQASKRVAKLPKSTTASPAAIAGSLSKALGALQPLLADFKKLDPPANLKATHDKTVKGLADGLAIGNQIAEAVGKGSDLTKAMAKVQAPFLLALSTIQTGFKQLGLTKCESVLGAAIGGA